MQPAFGGLDETLQELGGGDRTAVAGAGVFHVGELRIDLLVVFRSQRHAPDALACRKSDLHQTLGQFVIVGEQARIFGAKCDHDGAG